jgi:hypothetical protein
MGGEPSKPEVQAKGYSYLPDFPSLALQASIVRRSRNFKKRERWTEIHPRACASGWYVP